jgi:hypothetical protein
MEVNVRSNIDFTKDSQLNDIDIVGYVLSSSIGLKMDGVEGLANASMNRVIYDIYSVDGVGVRSLCSDSNIYIQGRGFASGTALRNFSMGAGSVAFEGTRNDRHLFNIGNKGMGADAGTQPAYSIRVLTDRLDDTPDPDNSNGSKIYSENESTPVYNGDVLTVTPTPVPGTGAFTSGSTVLNYWQTLNDINFELAISFVDNTGNNSINVPMPIACKAGAQGSGTGVNPVNRVGVIWTIDGASSTLVITNADGTYPGGGTKSIRINGKYRVAQ